MLLLQLMYFPRGWFQFSPDFLADEYPCIFDNSTRVYTKVFYNQDSEQQAYYYYTLTT